MRSIKELKNIKGKKILVRVDFNVPIKNGKIQDDFRIKKSLPTIKFLQKKGASVVLLSHLGKDGKQSLKPVADYLKRFVKNVVLLENLRRFPGEEENNPKFAQDLAKLGDIYVNDAFSVCHRKHASIIGLPKYLPSYAGLQLEEEIKNLSHAFQKPKHPFLFILGGAKFTTKMPLIKKYLKLADHVFIGGALANDFLKARGYEIGKSLVSDSNFGISRIIKNKKLVLPSDFIIKNESIIDIGQESVKNLESIIKKSKLILWNGPLGKYEAGGALSTKEVLKLVASSKAESIVGGGDTVDLISKMKIEKKFSFVSTGGGATLEFLATGTLAGIKALK